MILPLTAAAPRLLTEETCAPAMLTSAEVISIPEVDSAFSTERVMACDAAARSTIMPFLIPSEGSMPTPRMRMERLSSTRPTSVHTLVVPTSMPTTISSINTFFYRVQEFPSTTRRAGVLLQYAPNLLTQSVIRCRWVGHIDHRGFNASFCQ